MVLKVALGKYTGNSTLSAILYDIEHNEDRDQKQQQFRALMF
ncbi:hypothetical protein COLO4_28971 [Corchorus olitorius]|uniref:Uncharacterized protein n=1 Tax=Corchorus olitorius TaxID=93759 RepID=A0A1R3HH77_9ROSI|nr:hypothetical protein COLO4_28971 [Corchorus olitorius]